MAGTIQTKQKCFILVGVPEKKKEKKLQIRLGRVFKIIIIIMIIIVWSYLVLQIT